MSDEKVVPFANLRKAKANGETTFMLCACGSRDGLLPVVLHDANEHPILVSLVCPSCENEAAIINGRVVVSK